MLMHDIFYNRQRSGCEELQSYQPKYYRSIKEMVAINKFAGHTLERMSADMEQAVLDRFIISCSEEQLERFENFLELTDDISGKSIEQRKMDALMKWNGNGKMTGTRIKAIVYACCNCDCDVTFTSTQLIVDMVFKDNPSYYMDGLRNMLKNSTIPGHIEILYRGSVDITVVVDWVNYIETSMLRMKTDFLMNHAKYFNGSQLLDGSQFMNQGYDWIVTSDNNKLSLAYTEDFNIYPIIPIDVTNKAFYGQFMKNKTENTIEESVECSSELYIEEGQRLDNVIEIEIRKNLYYLDGNRSLDGSLLVNAYIKKEDI